MNTDLTIFKFENGCSINDWAIVDDVVMGGRSQGSIQIADQGYGVYAGSVSIENNGGFSSVKYDLDLKDIQDYKFVRLHIKGDGKSYQFRVKRNRSDAHAYIHKFSTDESWQMIEIKLSDMYPTFRGRSLNMPNYKGDSLEEIRFLISSKSNESFELCIDSITLHN